MHYAAFLEGLTVSQERQLTSLLFEALFEYLNVDLKKSKFTCPDKTQKIVKQGKVFFYYNPNSQLFETAHPKQCQEAIVAVSQKLRFPPECIDFFRTLRFVSSAEEALMLSLNGLLFSKMPRMHKSSHEKTITLYDGPVTAKFGLEQILARNSGLVFGHVHTDSSSYRGLSECLPLCKQQGVEVIYLELPYVIFSSLFESFNKSKGPDTSHIMSKLAENALYKGTALAKNLQKIFISAKKENINICACDVFSQSIISQSIQIDEKHRLNVGNACMIRSIEKLQFDHKNPKFLVLVGLAHAKNIAQELGVPSCCIGEKRQLQEFQKYIQAVDYLYLTQNRALYSSAATPLTSTSNRLNQSVDPKINAILDYWNKLTQKMPAAFSHIPDREIKGAREVYVEYILEKSSDGNNKLSDICTSSQSFVIELLINAIYPKCVELVHPKNWPSLFYCQRPYGIRLLENEAEAFTVPHLNELELALATDKAARTQSEKLHYT